MIEINNKTKVRINKSLVKKITENFLKKYHKKNHEVSIAFVGDTTIRQLNKKYLNQDRVTDVLVFDGEGKFLGEIIIDYAQVKRQAGKFGNSTKEELIFVLVHGLLHLLGYEDKTGKERKRMEDIGKEFIKKYNANTTN